MRSLSLVTLTVMAALITPSAALAAKSAGVRLAKDSTADAQLIIKLRPGVNVQLAQGIAGLNAFSADARLNGVLSNLGINRLKPLFPGVALKSSKAQLAAPAAAQGLQRVHVVQVPAANRAKALRTLRADPAIEYVEPDRKVYVSSVNDPYLSSYGSWGQGYADLWGHQTAGVPAAWARSNGSGVLVAVVDTGIDINHEDLAGNIAVNSGEIAGNGIDDDGNGYIDDYYGWDFDDGTNTATDAHGHGTHVAGTIAAVANNARGLAGVAWGARLLNVKIMSDNGSGYMSSAAEGLVYAADRGARVISNSWGGPSSQVVDDAVAYARSKGALVVTAAGNDYGADVEYVSPAGAPGTLVVSATTAADTLASFSNIGQKLDIAAPGVDILSALAPSSVLGNGNPGLVVGGNYLRISGTSMATPHVSGAAALLLSMQPTLTAEQVRYWLRNGAQDLGDAGFDRRFGYGRLRADTALDLAASGSAPLVSGAFTAPLRGAYLGGTAQIFGQANGAGFASYELAWQRAGSNVPYATFFSSTTPTPNSASALLGSFNTSSLASGEYYLRLRVRGSNGAYLDYYDRAYVDPTMKAGWPRVLSHESMTGAGSWEYEATLVDMDNDGSKEIAVAALDTLFVFNADGSNRPGFPVFTGNVCDITGTVTAADLNNDNKPELVFPCWAEPLSSGVVAAVDGQGNMLPGFPAGVIKTTSMSATAAATRGHVAVSDMNNDGKKEIIISGMLNNSTLTRSQAFVAVLNAQGQMQAGWPQLAAVNPVNVDLLLTNGRNLVADVDRDGVEEVVINEQTTSAGGARLVIYRLNGTLLRSIDLSSQMAVAYHPLFADMNADGTQEFVMVGCRTDGTQYATVVSATGTTLPGWPRAVSNPGGACDATRTPWTVVDLDQDKKLELVVGTDTGLHAINAQGVSLSGWPKVLGTQFHGANIAVAPFAGKPIVLLFQLDNRLWAVDRTGVTIPGWPKGVAIAASLAPATGTLDNSGKLAIVANTTIGDLTNYNAQLMVFEETLTAGGLPPGCTMFRCDVRRSGSVAPAVVSYNKVYNSVYLRGTHNNWATNAPMQLVGHNTWEATVNFGSTSTERFKFDINGDWATNFGDTNRDLIADPAGADIQVTQGAGSYRVRFNDSTRAYSVTRLGGGNQAPVANAGADQNISSSTPVAVQLNGSASTDADGSIASYVWEEYIGGSWQNVGSGAVLVLNSVSVAQHRYRLTVTDNLGATSSDEVLVTIAGVGYNKNYNQVYVRGTNNAWATSGMSLVANNQWEVTVTFGSTTTERFKFDIHGDWTLNFGDTNKDLVADAAGADILITQGAGSYRIRFNDSTRVYSVTRIGGTNQAPVANAGADQNISSSTPTSVTLNGSASADSDGTIVSYYWDEYVNSSWQNVGSGVSATLSNVSVGQHRYRLTVTDNGGLSSSDEVLVTIAPAGFTKVYNQVYVRGTNNNWGTTSMTLVANNTWETTVPFGATSTERFKFDIHGNWSLNFGDNNADGVAEQTGSDIQVKAGAGNYKIRFNDQTRVYTVVKQ